MARLDRSNAAAARVLALLCALAVAGCQESVPESEPVAAGEEQAKMGVTMRTGRHPFAEVAAAAQVSGTIQDAPLYRAEFLSPTYTIDRLYSSMEGPSATERAVLYEAKERELLWITGYRAEVTEPDGRTPRSPEFMCHNNLETVKSSVFRKWFPTDLGPRAMRVFSLDQGTLDVDFPAGYGVPAFSDQNFKITSQVLNHNVVSDTFDVRQRISVDFVRNRDLTKPLQPLVMRPVFNLVLLEGEDGHFGIPQGHGADENGELGPGCSIALDAGHPQGLVPDQFGRNFSSFWIVPPGVHEYHTRVTTQLDIPYDTTIHYASAHLHPFAESIELYDLTAKETVFKLEAEQVTGGVGLAAVDTVSSQGGLRLYHDHEYDLVTLYANDSGEGQTAMATLFLYVQIRDLIFEPDPESPPYGRWYKVPPAKLISPNS